MKFKPASISGRQLRLAKEAVSLSGNILGLDSDCLSIRFFTPDPNGTVKDGCWAREQEHNLKGLFRAPDEIWIRNDLTDKELVITIGHECCHYKQHLKGLDMREDQAEGVGELILKELLSKRQYNRNILYYQ